MDKLVEKAKAMIDEGKLDEAKKFIEEHKDEIGQKVPELMKMIGGNADDMMDKVKGLFGKK